MKSVLQFSIPTFIVCYFFASVFAKTWDFMKFSETLTYFWFCGTALAVILGMLVHILIVKDQEIDKYYDHHEKY